MRSLSQVPSLGAFGSGHRPMPRMLNSVPSPSPSNFPSWHVPPPEKGFVLDTSAAGSQTSEQPAYTNLNHDFERHADQYYGQDFFPPSRGYNSRAPEPPSASSQFSVSPRGKIDPLTFGSTAYPVVYTGGRYKGETDALRASPMLNFTVHLGRQRHGDTLCSYPGNGCVSLCM